MKKFTTVAVIAALALASQAFAMGGNSRGGQKMSSSMSATTKSTDHKMAAGTHTMTSTRPINGTGSMIARMPATETKISPGTPIHATAAR